MTRGHCFALWRTPFGTFVDILYRMDWVPGRRCFMTANDANGSRCVPTHSIRYSYHDLDRMDWHPHKHSIWYNSVCMVVAVLLLSSIRKMWICIDFIQYTLYLKSSLKHGNESLLWQGTVNEYLNWKEWLGGRASDFCNTNLLTGLFVQKSGVRFPVAAYLVLEQGLYLQLFQIPISRWRGLLSLNR